MDDKAYEESVLLIEMDKFMDKNEGFRDYVLSNMRTYNKKCTDILKSPITQEYYKSLLKGGCNARGGADDEQ